MAALAALFISTAFCFKFASAADLGRPQGFLCPQIDRIGFMRKEVAAPAGVISGAQGHKTLIGEGDIVYVQAAGGSSPLELGKMYAAYTVSDPIKDEAGACLGVQHIFTGVVKILKKTDRFWTAKVMTSYRAMGLNHFIGPFVKKNPRILIPEAVKEIHGAIIKSEDGRHIFAKGTVAFIDKGKIDGVAPGQGFAIYSRKKSAPVEEIGSLVVIHLEETTSTVLITRSVKSIFPGAKIASAPIFAF